MFWRTLEIQDGGPIWPTFRNHDVISASCDVTNHDADLKGNHFRRTIHPQSFTAVAFIFSELDSGGLPEPFPGPEGQKKKARSG